MSALFCLALSTASCTKAKNVSALQPGMTGTIAIVADRNADAELIQRVAKFIQANFRAMTRQIPAIVITGTTPGQLLQEARTVTGDGDVLVLLVVDASAFKFRDPVLQLSNNVALLNMASLKPERLDKPQDQERYAWRLEKEAMRAIGQMVGLKPCPIPQCAMFAHTNLQQLDVKGRNLCPPCLVKSESILETKGIESIYNRTPVPPGKTRPKKH